MALGSLGKLFVEVGADTSDLEKGLDGAEKQVNAFGKSVKKTGAAIGAGMSKAGRGLTAGVTLPLAAAGAGFVVLSGKAAAFENQMNEVFTLLPNMSKTAMDAMSDDVLKFSRDMGVLPSETVPALYQAISAGVPKENVFDFMTIASKASIAGVTDLETAVDGITSVVNAYGSDVIDATKASDLMFTAVKLGKTNFEELSQSLFQVIPTASALGVGFGDVTAALASMTAQGTPTRVATTQLRQMMVELSKSGSDASTAFQEIAGVGFKEFIAQGNNLEDALKIMADAPQTILGKMTTAVEEAVSGNEDAMRRLTTAGSLVYDTFKDVAGVSFDKFIAQGGTAEEAILLMRDATQASTAGIESMFGSVEAGQAALALTGKGAEGFGNNIDAMNEAVGATDKAFATMDEGASRSMDKLKAEFSATMIEIGNEFIPILKDDLLPIFRDDIAPLLKDVVVPAIKGLANAFSAMSPGMKKASIVVLALAAALGPVLMVLGPIISGVTALAPVLAAVGGIIGGVILSPVLLVVGAIAAVIAILYILEKKFGVVTKAIEIIGSVLKTLWDNLDLLLNPIAAVVYAFEHWDEIVTVISGVFRRVFDFLMNLDKEFKKAGWNLMIALAKGILAGASKAVDAVKGALGTVRSYLPGSDAKVGPLSDITASGAALMTTFDKGIASSTADPAATFAARAPQVPAAGPASITNSSSVTMGDVNLSSDYNFEALMGDINRHQAQQRTQRGAV